jgi:vacuolar-type H+-ATPase subunit H
MRAQSRVVGDDHNKVGPSARQAKALARKRAARNNKQARIVATAAAAGLSLADYRQRRSAEADEIRAQAEREAEALRRAPPPEVKEYNWRRYL